jgi:hypothetical protein
VIGVIVVRTAAAEICGVTAPDAFFLLKLVFAVVVKQWYHGGAYCEAVMRGVRRLQFRLFYENDEIGDTYLRKWYIACKVKGGKNIYCVRNLCFGFVMHDVCALQLAMLLTLLWCDTCMLHSVL